MNEYDHLFGDGARERIWDEMVCKRPELRTVVIEVPEPSLWARFLDFFRDWF